MNKKVNIWIFIGGVVLVAALSYFFGPRRVKIQKKIVEKKVEVIVEKVVENRVVDRRVERRPDGTVIETERTAVARAEDRASTSQTETKKEFTKKIAPAASLSILGGIGVLGDNSQSYAFGIQKDLVGPVGIWGLGTFHPDNGLGAFVGLSLRF